MQKHKKEKKQEIFLLKGRRNTEGCYLPRNV
jgi:hypothetical protein